MELSWNRSAERLARSPSALETVTGSDGPQTGMSRGKHGVFIEPKGDTESWLPTWHLPALHSGAGCLGSPAGRIRHERADTTRWTRRKEGADLPKVTANKREGCVTVLATNSPSSPWFARPDASGHFAVLGHPAHGHQEGDRAVRGQGDQGQGSKTQDQPGSSSGHHGDTFAWPRPPCSVSPAS